MFSKNKWILANRNLLVAVSLSILTIASCGGGGGGSGSSSPNEKPVSVSLTATPSIVGPGETTTLNWVSTNAKSCELMNQAGVKVASGLSDAYTTTLPLDSAAAFTITCTGVTAGDTVSQTKTFAKVSANPTVTLNASPPSVASGAKTTISWSSSNSTSCKFTDGSLYGAPDTYLVLLTSGSFNTAVLTGPATRTFTIKCDGPGGSTTQSTAVTVGSPAPVISSFIATPSSIISGAGTILSWASSNSTSCSLLGIGPVATTGTLPDSPPTTTTYTLTCTGAGGSVSASTTVSVAATTPPPTVTLTPASTSITSGSNTTITWSATAGSSCTFTSGAGAPSGAITTDGNNVTFTTPALTSTTTYSVSCTKTGLTASQSATINVVSGTCSTTGATDAISLPGVVASRTIGVAPLSVFFDATGATASATTRPFHELEYRWEFEVNPSTDIPAVGTTWGAGSRSGVSRKNSATGPVAAHVYETPGTYKVNLTVTDGTNTVTNKCTQITVHDPDVIFAGASLTGPNTICVGSTSTPTPGANGCPAGALGVQQANFTTAISNYAKTGKRVLFKRGDVFTASSIAWITVTGPGTIGAYGAGNLPVISATYDDAILVFSKNSTPNLTHDLKDWRVIDLDFMGFNTNNSNAIVMSGGINQLTLLRLTAQKVKIPFSNFDGTLNSFNASANVSYHGHTIWDQISIVDSTINHLPTAGINSHGVFLGGDRVFFAGNSVDMNVVDSTTITEHDTRFWYLGKAIISNNTLQRPGHPKHSLKLHAPVWGASGVAQNGAGGGYSKWVNISDNKFVAASNQWIATIGPQNTTSDERVRGVIVERNWFVSAAGSIINLLINAQDVTIRNNIFYAASTNATGVSVNPRGIEPPPSDIHIYNNVYYSSYSNPTDAVNPIAIGATATNVTVKNNIGYAPFSTNIATAMIKGTGASGFIALNNSTDLLINPMFTATPPISPNDYVLQAGSYGINSGSAVPVWSDFAGISKPFGTTDMGIYEQ